MIVERPALEHRVRTALAASRIPVLLGGCGSGRTTTLRHLERTLGLENSQYLDLAAAASTPERCLGAVLDACRVDVPEDLRQPPASPLAAFEGLTRLFDEARTSSGTPCTFLLDEFLDVRTFENFPGLRQVQRDTVARLAASPASFVLASRFTARSHRLLRDAPARFEVIHMPALDIVEARALAERIDDDRRGWHGDLTEAVLALGNGHPAYVHLLFDALNTLGPRTTDPIAALASLLAPDGALTARCRECYDYRLHRARGYGALKAILGVLADREPLNLTEIAQALHRTPGSTKDYLSWLEDVDLITVQGRRYRFTDAVLRVYVRLYSRATPPDDADIVRAVGLYARERLPEVSAPVDAPAPVAAADRSGIIEID